jgi:hypothetical protein
MDRVMRIPHRVKMGQAGCTHMEVTGQIINPTCYLFTNNLKTALLEIECTYCFVTCVASFFPSFFLILWTFLQRTKWRVTVCVLFCVHIHHGFFCGHFLAILCLYRISKPDWYIQWLHPNSPRFIVFFWTNVSAEFSQEPY